jgi:translation initiation factor 3 subunit H
MAAALAASLPAAPVAAAPAAPTYQAIPASMSKVIDIEADISLNVVQLDALVRYPYHRTVSVLNLFVK